MVCFAIPSPVFLSLFMAIELKRRCVVHNIQFIDHLIYRIKQNDLRSIFNVLSI